MQRRFLLHSCWTALTPIAGSAGECHFEIVEVHRELVTLRAVLTRHHYSLPIDALEDSAVWALGWRALRPR